jgi:hypothetical protein
MRLTWHIFAKDLLRLRLPLILWGLLMAAKVAFYAAIAGVFGPPNLEWLGHMMDAPILVIRSTIEPLIAFVLAGCLIYEDPLVGTDPFWVTRPISGGRLLGAKILGAGILFVLLPVLINVPWWLSCGFGDPEMVRAAVPMAIKYSMVVAIGMACASATDAFPRFFLWAIVAIAGIAMIHLFAAGFLGLGSIISTNRDTDVGQSLTRLIIFALCLLALSLEIIGGQFLFRRFKPGLIGLGAATVLASALAFRSSFNFLQGAGIWDREVTHGSEPIHLDLQDHSPFDVQVVVADSPKMHPIYKPYSKGSPHGNMFVPVFLRGMPADTSAFWNISAEWNVKGASLWKANGWGRVDDVDAMRRALGIEKGGGELMGANWFAMPRSLAERMRREPATIHATMQIHVLHRKLSAELTPRNQTVRYDGGSSTISDFEGKGDEISAVVTNRSETLSIWQYLGLVWPRQTNCVLVNRSKGEMKEGRSELLTGWGLQLNGVQIASQRVIYFKLLQSGWRQEDTKIVVFEFNKEQIVNHTVDMNPFTFAFFVPDTP